MLDEASGESTRALAAEGVLTATAILDEALVEKVEVPVVTGFFSDLDVLVVGFVTALELLLVEGLVAGWLLPLRKGALSEHL